MFAIGGISVVELDDNVRHLTSLLRLDSPSLVQVFYRLQKNNTTFYSAKYGRVKKRNSYTVTYYSDNEILFGQIQYFIHFSTHQLAVLKQLTLLTTSLTQHFSLTTDAMDHRPLLCPCTIGTDLVVVHTSALNTKCLFVHFDSRMYVATFPSMNMLCMD